jgi:hypothetical protein
VAEIESVRVQEEIIAKRERERDFQERVVCISKKGKKYSDGQKIQGYIHSFPRA